MSDVSETKASEGQMRDAAGHNGTGVIGFVDVAAILWKRKALMIGITLAVVVAALAYLVGSVLLPVGKSYLPDVYTAEARLAFLPEGGDRSIISAALSTPRLLGFEDPAARNASGAANAGVSGLLAMHDIPLPPFDYGGFTQELAASGVTLDALDAKFGFSKRLKDEGKAASAANTRGFIKKGIRTGFDPKTNILRVSFTDYDPQLAKSVVDEIVRLLEAGFVGYRWDKLLGERNLLEKKLSYMENTVKSLKAEIGKTPSGAAEYANLQRDLQVQNELFRILAQEYGLVKLAMAVPEPVFRVRSAAEVPDGKSGPSRAILLVWAVMAGFFLAVFLVVLVESVEKVKNDPDSAARFRALSSKKTLRG